MIFLDCIIQTAIKNCNLYELNIVFHPDFRNRLPIPYFFHLITVSRKKIVLKYWTNSKLNIDRMLNIKSGIAMKAIYIGNKKLREIDLLDPKLDEELFVIMNEYSLMESHVIYFSAGDSKIKEILIKKDPTFSV